MSYQCPMCQSRGKDWNGSDPKCAFDKTGVFSRNNWMCATMNALRDLCAGKEVYSEDHYVAALGLRDYDDTHEHPTTHVVLNWYKNRGATPFAIEMTSDHAAIPLRLSTAEAVIRSAKPAMRSSRR